MRFQTVLVSLALGLFWTASASATEDIGSRIQFGVLQQHRMEVANGIGPKSHSDHLSARNDSPNVSPILAPNPIKPVSKVVVAPAKTPAKGTPVLRVTPVPTTKR